MRTVREMLANSKTLDLDAVIISRATYETILATLQKYRDRRPVRVGVRK